MTTSATANECPVRPAAPVPPPRRMGFLALWRTVRENPIATVPQPVYEKPVVWLGRWWKPSLFLNDPAGIERVLLGNAANYRKSPQQQRRIQPALGDGLLTADGETWRAGRRIAAPLFSPKAVAALNDDMVAAAEAMSARWRDECAQGPLDLAAQFQRLTYEIVSRTVFSGALDAERVMVHTEMARYFDSIGRVDLAALLNLPSWIPSWSQWRGRSGIAAFRDVIGRGGQGSTRGPRERDRIRRSARTPVARARSADRRADARRHRHRQCADVSRGRPRDHRQCAHLDRLSA